MSGSVLDGNDPFSIANGIFPNGLVNAGERAPGVRTSTDTRSHNVSDLLDPAGGKKICIYIFAYAYTSMLPHGRRFTYKWCSIMSIADLGKGKNLESSKIQTLITMPLRGLSIQSQDQRITLVGLRYRA